MKSSTEGILTVFGVCSRRKDISFTDSWMNTAFLIREIREIWDPPIRAPCLVRLITCDVTWYPRGCRLWQIHPLPFTQLARHSNCIIRNSFSKFTSIDPICSAQQDHLSQDVALHHAQTVLDWDRLCMSIYHRWEEAKSPPKDSTISLL